MAMVLKTGTPFSLRRLTGAPPPAGQTSLVGNAPTTNQKAPPERAVYPCVLHRPAPAHHLLRSAPGDREPVAAGPSGHRLVFDTGRGPAHCLRVNLRRGFGAESARDQAVAHSVAGVRKQNAALDCCHTSHMRGSGREPGCPHKTSTSTGPLGACQLPPRPHRATYSLASSARRDAGFTPADRTAIRTGPGPWSLPVPANRVARRPWVG